MLVKSPLADDSVHMHKTVRFMQQAHERANRCCKNQASGCGEDRLSCESDRVEDVNIVGRHNRVKMLFMLNNHCDPFHPVWEHLPVA